MTFETLRRALVEYRVDVADVERVIDVADNIVQFDVELAALNLRSAAALALHQARRDDLHRDAAVQAGDAW